MIGAITVVFHAIHHWLHHPSLTPPTSSSASSLLISDCCCHLAKQATGNSMKVCHGVNRSALVGCHYNAAQYVEYCLVEGCELIVRLPECYLGVFLQQNNPWVTTKWVNHDSNYIILFLAPINDDQKDHLHSWLRVPLALFTVWWWRHIQLPTIVMQARTKWYLSR